MSPRLARVSLLLVLAALLLPVAAADHAYSHRYVIYGRVVDANGDPVPGLTVSVIDHNFGTKEGPCNDQPNTGTDAYGRTQTVPQTNQFGEWMYCYHAHEISRVDPPTATIVVTDKADTRLHESNLTFDADFRESYVPIKLDKVMDGANRTAFSQFYTVQARVWQPGATTLEGNHVYGLTLVSSPINVTLTLPDGSVLRQNTSTNGYGDFAVRFAVPQKLTAGTVAFTTASNQSWSAPVDGTMGITMVQATLAAPPGKSPLPTLLAVGAVAVVAVGGGFGYRALKRAQEKRAEERARASSTRKRAQR